VLAALFGCATLGASLALFMGWPAAMLTGALAFLSGMQVWASFTRRADKRATAREMALLRQRSLEFERTIDETKSRIAELDSAFVETSRQRERKIVSELKMLEGLMRDLAGKTLREARAPLQPPLPVPDRPHAPAADSHRGLLEMIRSALEKNRVDLYLQPIVSLPQRKLRYYEALSRLRSEDGVVIMPAQYISVAASAGLMSVVDNLLLFRCVQIVRRLTQRSKEIGVFCNISGETLADAEFFPQFLDYMAANRDLSGQIIFEFHQDAVLRAGAQGEKNLAALAAMGFALSMDHVATLGMDFAKLRGLGFRHLKVQAGLMTGGMNGAQVAAEDFTRLLARHGLNLIAEHVEDEKTVVQLLDYAVDFAQGYLFGEPRAVREDGARGGAASDPAAVIQFRKSA
jgi:cyclic-di-GMP phosphodiesterase TipF (flagellum assembly factor)